jgi:hypothetical protein
MITEKMEIKLIFPMFIDHICVRGKLKVWVN